MSNKRITELVPLDPAQLANSDLFAIADVSIPETKKITAEDFAAWVAASASLTLSSASYSKTASFLIFPPGSLVNGTASYALSASWAALAYSASYVLSSSYSVTSSYAITCSHCLEPWSGAYYIATASYLLYNTSSQLSTGTASYAFTSSHALWSRTSSFVYSASLTQNSTTASYSLTSSVLTGVNQTLSVTSSWATNAKSSSFLIWGANNGSASWAQLTPTASEAARLRSITNSNLFREWGPFSSSIIGTTTEAKTASFGFFEVTGSGAKIIVEAWGSVWVSQSNNIAYSGSVLLYLSESNSVNFELNEVKFQNYFTSSDISLSNHTGSITFPFYLKGKAINPNAADRYQIAVYARNGSSFSTSSISGIQCSFKVNNDTVAIDRTE